MLTITIDLPINGEVVVASTPSTELAYAIAKEQAGLGFIARIYYGYREILLATV
jgi:hypothetical protein